MDKDIQRFIDYVKIDTQSDDQSFTVPSTAKQLNLSRKLQADLKELGIDSELDEFGCVYARLDGEKGLDPIGLNSHVDTALECSGENVKPKIIENYDGGRIELGHGYSMSPAEFPTLGDHIGDTLITTSGDTLLGADDKAGLAIIMAVLDHYVSHPEEKHHPICVLFTPDEEIGRGPDHFNPEKFGAKYAYTVDGGVYDEIACKTFNAAHADVILHGISIHPGEAKGKMVNASDLAFAFDHALPAEKRPQFTEGYEGFNHLVSLTSGVDEAKMHYIIRNHDRAKLEEQKEEFRKAREAVLKAYPGVTIDLSIGDDYRNMKEVIDTCPECVEKVCKAYEKLGFKPIWKPIRGGTDGAGFSFKGVPTPNLPTGSFNHHGRFEYLSVTEFKRIKAIVIEMLRAE
ncbi:MAG: peptidase T [Erysipelotrichaceae bacterium]|nr:peptidase T [Erysipelotrichaceae bacterium]